MAAAMAGAVDGWGLFSVKFGASSGRLSPIQGATSLSATARSAHTSPLTRHPHGRRSRCAYAAALWSIPSWPFSARSTTATRTPRALIQRVVREGGPIQLGRSDAVGNNDIDEQIDALGLRETVGLAVPANLECARIILAAKFAPPRSASLTRAILGFCIGNSGIAFAPEEVVLAYAEANATQMPAAFSSSRPGIANPPGLRTREIR